MKLYTSLLGLFIFLTISSNAWAEKNYRVVTIYFAGTGMSLEMWDGDHTVELSFAEKNQLEWWFAKPELLSTMYRNQKGESTQPGGNTQKYTHSEESVNWIHHKHFIYGIGSNGWSAWGKTIPAWQWSEINNEAISCLKSISQQYEDEIILNLAGFSRGGVSAMIFSKYVSEHMSEFKDRVKKINMLLFDPVPGFQPSYEPIYPSSSYFRFDNSNHTINGSIVLFYSEDERSRWFRPIYPLTGNVDTYRYLVKGSHETMIGNLRAHGHAPARVTIIPLIDSWDHDNWRLPQQTQPELAEFTDMIAMAASSLLGLPEWGSAEFTNDSWVDEDSDVWCNPTTDNCEQETDSGIPYNAFSYNSVFEKISAADFLSVNYWESWKDKYFSSDTYPGYSWMRFVQFFPLCGLDSSQISRECWTPLNDNFAREYLEFKSVQPLSTLYWDYLYFMPGNRPQVSAGGDAVFLSSDNRYMVSLDGSETQDIDEEGTSQLFYEWTNCDTHTVLSSGLNDSQPTFLIENKGDLSEVINVCLVVTDGAYASKDTVTITLLKDSDNDRIADIDDNCPSILNSDQSDFDGDNLGDLCDDDLDGDGVTNAVDDCQFTELGAVVNPAHGCSIKQLCPSDMPWKNHGEYVFCITNVAREFADASLISKTEKNVVITEAGQSDVGR